MGKVWVQATGILHVEEHGKMKVVRPGDWVQVGKHDARRWMAEGKCTIQRQDTKQMVQDFANCAVSLSGAARASVKSSLQMRYPDLDVVLDGGPSSAARTMVWDTSVRFKFDLILVGFGLLRHGWQVIVPLVDYDTLARDVGSEEDRRRTKEMIHDLRVPVYDPRIVFARRCQATRDLFDAWEKEKAGGGHEGLAFLRALHRVKPLVNALPPFWVGG